MRHLLRGKWFDRAVKKSFKDADLSKDGKIDKRELAVALLRTYDFINKSLPVHVEVPTDKEIAKLLEKYDSTSTGSLDYKEYRELCLSLVGRPSRWQDSVLVKVGVVMVARLLAYPWLAQVLRAGLLKAGFSLAKEIPLPALALVVELALKTLG